MWPHFLCDVEITSCLRAQTVSATCSRAHTDSSSGCSTDVRPCRSGLDSRPFLWLRAVFSERACLRNSDGYFSTINNGNIWSVMLLVFAQSHFNSLHTHLLYEHFQDRDHDGMVDGAAQQPVAPTWQSHAHDHTKGSASEKDRCTVRFTVRPNIYLSFQVKTDMKSWGGLIATLDFFNI